MLIDEKKLSELVDSSYSLFRVRGYHDGGYSLGHLLMLCICDVSNAVSLYKSHGTDAHSDLSLFNDSFRNRSLVSSYRLYVLDSVGSSLAMCAIRIFDLFGYLGIPVRSVEDLDDLYFEFDYLFHDYTFVERAFSLCSILGRCEDADFEDDGSGNSLPSLLSSALYFIFSWCDSMRIDYKAHIELRLSYERMLDKQHEKRE